MLETLPSLSSWALNFNPIVPPNPQDVEGMPRDEAVRICRTHARRALEQGIQHHHRRDADAATKKIQDAVDALSHAPDALDEPSGYTFDHVAHMHGTLGADAAYRQGLVARSLGDHANAAKKLTRAIDASATSKAHMYFMRGMSHLQSRDASAALHDFNRTLRDRPGYHQRSRTEQPLCWS